jgi:SOS response associated peptidase (SRAP)
MYGRYVRRSDKQKIAEHFAVHGPSLPDFGPSWNVAPQTFQPIVRLNRDTGEREIVLMRWGLIPYWMLLANSYGSANLPKCPEQRFATDRQFDLDQWRNSELYAIRLLSEVARSGSAQAVPSRRPDVEILAAVEISTGSLDMCQA